MDDITYDVKDIIQKIKSSGIEDSKLNEIEKRFEKKQPISSSDMNYLRGKLVSLTTGKRKYSGLLKTETENITSISKQITSNISNEKLRKICIKCGTNLLQKQIFTHKTPQRFGSTFNLSKKEKQSLKKNIRVNLEKFVKHEFSEKVCDACYHEILYDTKVFEVKCVELSKLKQNVDGVLCFQNFDEDKIVFWDNKGKSFKVIPVKKILNYQIIFNEQLSNYRKTRDTMSFMLFNRSEKEKEEREFPSELKSINSKLIELLSLDFMDEKGQNRFIFGSKNIYELYEYIDKIFKNNVK